jgi:outer membrane cobalamin receptor
LIKKLSFLIFFFFLFSNAAPQPQGSLSVDTDSTASDSLTKPSLTDTLAVSSISFIESDQFRNEVFDYFSLTDEITSEDIDNSMAESFGDLLQMKSLIDIVKIGPWGQPENVYLSGNGRGVNIFIDGNLIQQQDLYFPQKGEQDLNSISLSNVSRVEFLPAGLANLWGGGSGVMGVNVVTKDFDGDQPYSRALTDRGPFGFHRTGVELGRGLATRGKIYLTGEFKKSDGYLLNSDYDGISLSGKTTFNLTRNMDLKLFAYQYQTKMGLTSFPDANFQDTRRKVNNWGTVTSLLRQEKPSSVLNLSFRYDKQNQEVKSSSYGFETKKSEEMYALTATQTFIFKERHYIKAEGYGERKSFEALKIRQRVYGGYLSLADVVTANPRLKLLLFSKIEKEEKLDAGFSFSGGVSYLIANNVSLFSTCGRFVGYPTLMDRFWLPDSLYLKNTTTDYIEEGNHSLASQKSFVADFGANIQKENYHIGTYIFHSLIDDFIFWSNVDTTIYFGHFKSIDSKASIWGTNLNVSCRFFDHMKSYLSYSFKKGKDSRRKTQLPYSPEHSLFGFIEFENEFLKREIGLKLRLETNVLSERFMDEYQKDKEPGVATVNGKITIRFLDFHFYYVARNITNQAYRLSADYLMPERTFWWGFYWEFFD